jgi:hypothetical protein
VDVCLERTRVALRSPAPVPKTCPQDVVRLDHGGVGTLGSRRARSAANLGGSDEEA